MIPTATKVPLLLRDVPLSTYILVSSAPLGQSRSKEKLHILSCVSTCLHNLKPLEKRKRVLGKRACLVSEFDINFSLAPLHVSTVKPLHTTDPELERADRFSSYDEKGGTRNLKTLKKRKGCGGRTLDAAYVYAVPWSEFLIVPSYPHSHY